MSFLLSPITNAGGMALQLKLPISLLAGEMAGRPEGGAVPPAFAVKKPESHAWVTEGGYRQERN
jgi:hypothetical protein